MAAKKRKSGKRRKPAESYDQGSFLGWLLKWAFVGALWAGIFLAGLFAWYAQELPSITKSATFERKQAIIVKAIDGSVAARYGEIVGNSVTAEDLPPFLIQAVLSIEDRRFYQHFGIDPLGLLRAVAVNIREGKVTQGGSTVTQQLAKNLFLSQERTLKRKIQEAMLALWLEYELTKDEIMSAYLNRVYMGSGTYGVDAAARLYFDKPVNELDLRECATIAGLLKAPSRYSPISNPSLSKQRAETVLAAMVDAGYITEEQAQSGADVPPVPTEKPANELTERFYTDWIVDQLDDLIGTPTEDLIVETTLNPKIQNIAQQTIDEYITANGEERKFTQGAMVLMRPNGEVVAIIGGKNYSQSQFNRATQALRPPGSAFKPVVYLTALEQGWQPDDLIEDAPITTGKYRPENFGNEYYGEVTLEEALAFSLNTVSFQLMKAMGPTAVINTAQRLGITSELQPDLSLALGSSGITLLEMANAYSTIANGGLSVQPYGITKIISKDTGEVYYERPDFKSMKRVFSEYDMQNLASMMHSVILHGTGRGANFGVEAAGKTGTSQDSRDALFMGFTRSLVGVVWIGNDDNSPMKAVTGGSFPAQIWRDVMSQSYMLYPAFNGKGFDPGSSFEALMKNLFFSNEESENPSRPGFYVERGWQRPPDQPQWGEERSIPEGNRYND